MAYTTIDDPSAYFQTVLYSGNGSTQSITNDGNSDLQPDWLWFKNRNSTQVHQLFDTNRGIANSLRSNGTDAENTDSPNDRLTAINTDGFDLGADGNPNNGSNTYVCWQWKANGGTTSSNTDGSITSTVQADTTAGFSIVTYTGTGSNATVGHGLGATPNLVIVKNRDSAGNNWFTHWTGLLSSDAHLLYIAATDAETSNATGFNSTAPTSSVFSVGTNTATNENTSGHVAYCFAEKQGYSKIGTYTGNGNTDGAFVYTGFKPAFLIAKEYNNTRNWTMAASKLQASGNGGNTNSFQPNTNAAQDANERMDWLSNGFKLRTTSTTWNTSGGKYVYLAFAESPFVSSEGVPTTAR